MTTISSTSNIAINYNNGSFTYTIGANVSTISSFPVTIVNTNSGPQPTTIILSFANPITITDASQYFIAGSAYIIFDGQNNTVTFSGVQNYPGLIQNGTYSSIGNNYITIQNINTVADPNSITYPTLSIYGGWICQSSFSNSGGVSTITNCYNTVSISVGYGGIGGCIIGSYASGTITVNNCYNTGAINDSYGGGIFGSYSSGPITVNNCYNTGAINGGGGIFGTADIFVSQTINVSNCYNTGVIGGGGGGIFAQSIGDISVSNCYNTGEIIYGGGIFGSVGDNIIITKVTITNCYNTGTVGTNSGGIIGQSPYYSSGTNIITNCYNAGSGDFIAGSATIPLTCSNGSMWTDTTAIATLTGTPISPNPIGTNWTTLGSNIPYLISLFNSEIYTPSVVNYTSGPFAPFSTSAGNVTSNANIVVSNNFSYEIIGITSQVGNSPITSYNGQYISINPSTGVILFQQGISTTLTSYVIYVIAGYNLSSVTTTSNLIYEYDISTFTAIDVSCFNHGTKILYLNNYLEDEYIPIQHLRKGDLVKTYLHGYKAIKEIGKGQLLNDPTISHHCMFKMEKTETNGLTEDLIVTGGHGIMVDELTETQSNLQEKIMFKQSFDGKHLLLASVSSDFQALRDNDVYTYYHFILENDGDIDKRYGVYANGLLMETPPERNYNSFPYTPI